MADEDRIPTPIENLAVVVQELYDFRDHFVERYGINEAATKENQVEQKMKECLNQFELLQDDIKNKAQVQLLKGRIFNVLTNYSSEAEEALSKAVKLDPKLVEAWNHLGECLWKKQDILGAKNCFTGALSHSKNKISLRNLSMVLRQQKVNPIEKAQLIEDSVQRAKEAVQLDIKDGASWSILGNAYLCQFFSKGQNVTILKQCMQAYSQAEKDPVAKGNPDLHYNRAVALKYQEKYEAALEGYQTATQLDPAWEEAKGAEANLVTFLRTVNEMVRTKGKTKQKKVGSLLRSLTDKDLGSYVNETYTNRAGKSISLTKCEMKNLEMKLNESKIVSGVVVCNVHTNERVPFTFCMMDAADVCVAVTVYNLAPGAGMKIGDRVAIPEPLVKKVSLSHKGMEISFTSIQVESPRSLVVNGRTLGADNEALATLTVSAMSE